MYVSYIEKKALPLLIMHLTRGRAMVIGLLCGYPKGDEFTSGE